MGRKPCCSKVGLNRGAWTATEDKILTDYIKVHGEGKWRELPKSAGLRRCGKSCRLRWLNYLRPDIKRGNISDQEEDLIIRLHRLLGNRWSLIAGRLPGRTDNEIKNYWNTNLRKKVYGQSSEAANIKLSEKKACNESCVIRTKALRCSKCLFVPRETDVADSKENMGADMAMAEDFLSKKGMALESSQVQSLRIPQEDDLANSLMDFDVSDPALPELLGSDMLELCDGGHEDLDNVINRDGNKSNSSPLDIPILFDEENLLEWAGRDCDQPDAASDFQSLASFLDSEQWFST